MSEICILYTQRNELHVTCARDRLKVISLYLREYRTCMIDWPDLTSEKILARREPDWSLSLAV